MSSRRFGRLPCVRLCALLLFIAALVLPVLVVLSRQAVAFSSSESERELDFRGDVREGAGRGDDEGSAPVRRLEPVLDAIGTPVLVFVARERGTLLEVHLPQREGEQTSACVGETRAREAVRITLPAGTPARSNDTSARRT